MNPGYSIFIGPAVAWLLAISPVEVRSLAGVDNAIFPTFTTHITRQVALDKHAFAQASTCLSWFYNASKKPAPPTVQGISWEMRFSSRAEIDCPRSYPGGMDAARKDFTKTQTSLSVSMTGYEFALIADHDDDQTYSVVELRDLFQALSLVYNTTDSPLSSIATLTAQFDQWYQARNLELVMTGMSALYDRGYRVTVLDRAELDRVMR